MSGSRKNPSKQDEIVYNYLIKMSFMTDDYQEQKVPAESSSAMIYRGLNNGKFGLQDPINDSNLNRSTLVQDPTPSSVSSIVVSSSSSSNESGITPSKQSSEFEPPPRQVHFK